MLAKAGWMSELEGALELEFEDADDAREFEDQTSSEFEIDDEAELGDEGEIGDEEFDDARELENIEQEFEASTDYGERLFELASREFESDLERQRAVYEVLEEMQTEHFLGGLIKKAGGLLKKVPIVKAATSLVGKNMNGLLGSLATNALSSLVPGGGLIAPLVKNALGAATGGGSSGAAGANPMNSPEVWNNFASLAKDAFEKLASSVLERVTAATQAGAGAAMAAAEIADPLVASQLANEVFRTTVRKHAARNAAPGQRKQGGKHVHTIRVPRGQKRILLKIEFV